MSDINADVAGGDRRGAAYLGRIGLIGDADLDRLLGWQGATAHISIHAIHGQGLSGHRVGNLLTVSGLEAEPAFRFEVIPSDASPSSPSRGNEGVYAIADMRLLRAGDRTLHAFVRASWSPPDRNLIDLYADGGLSLQGPVVHRPNDVVGLGFAYARISPQLRTLTRTQNLTTGTSAPLPSAEEVIEASYQLQFGGQFYLQPNAQFVIHPAAGAPAVTTGNIVPPAANALVLGLRTSLRF
jgi:carbohydrate-selective porin OprB